MTFWNFKKLTRKGHCEKAKPTRQPVSIQKSRSFSWVFRPAFFAGFLMVFVGCVSTRPTEPFQTKLFVGTYDEVWLATLKALNDYPLKLSNKDSGKIQTEVVNGPYNELVFAYPDPIELPERFRYSLTFKFAKLVDEGRKPLVRVRITKDLEQYQDFYTGWTAYSADGLEEKTLLYRIEHILGMEQSLAKQEEEKK